MEIQLSRIVDALPGLVWTALPDGHIDFLNQRWCEYTGLSLDEARGCGWQTVVHPEDLPQLLECWQSIFASGEPREMEARLRRSMASIAGSSSVLVRWPTPRDRSSNGAESTPILRTGDGLRRNFIRRTSIIAQSPIAFRL